MTPARTVDLRLHPVDDLLCRVERYLQVSLDRASLVRKRRSVGAATERGTWVRIERRPVSRVGTQGWNGAETAAALTGVSMPEWFAGVSWREGEEAVWRADETSLLPDAPVQAGTLTVRPDLPEEWWKQLSASLDALAVQSTSRVATPDTVTITQVRVTEAIRRTFSSTFDTTISMWVPAHADLNWANVTAPSCSLFDWEDWGMAPLGLDSASLWANSLAVPDLAERVWAERRRDLESRDGLLMAMFCLGKIVGDYADPADPKLRPAQRAAARIVGELVDH
ncbi:MULTISPECIES: hypothetical protein [unclassified Streptomyces]|uniref:hypothetical protein n=1 Tax=unclassified Streptomyces TaxID=2593676 RepID=UPI000CD51247|nr:MULTISPECIES: hypothetical protein [unclassified Streptomyces]